jgi:hypothetical protein
VTVPFGAPPYAPAGVGCPYFICRGPTAGSRAASIVPRRDLAQASQQPERHSGMYQDNEARFPMFSSLYAYKSDEDSYEESYDEDSYEESYDDDEDEDDDDSYDDSDDDSSDDDEDDDEDDDDYS